jgi:hypothetical protein
MTQVKKISTLSPDKASPADGRWTGLISGLVKADLKDHRSVLYRVFTTNGAATAMLYSGQDAPFMIGADTPVWKTFGFPSVSPSATRFTALGQLAPQKGVVSGSNDKALLYSTNATTFAAYAKEGDPAPGLGALTYSDFSDPLVNSNSDVAFLATVKGSGVKGSNNRALFFGTPLVDVAKVVRTGDTAPAAPTVPGQDPEPPSTFASLGSFVLPSGSKAGPVFTAKLSGKGVNAKNNQGLFAVSSDGSIRRLLRTGDDLGGETVKKFTVFQALSGVFSSARSFNNTGAVVVAVSFSNHNTALLPIGIP